MTMNRYILVPLVFLGAAACKILPGFERAKLCLDGEKKPGVVGSTEPQVKMELQDIHYDGETLSGRLLVGVVEGSVRLDKRLFTDIDVNVRRVSECKTGFFVPYIIFDSFPKRGCEDLLVLERGYWYGTVVRFPLFDEHLTQLGPECIDVELSLRSFDGKAVARTEIRAERPHRPSDAGVPDAPEDDGGVEVHFTGKRAGP